MKAQEKAKELVDKYYNILPLDKYVITKDEDLSWEYNDWKEAKQCALIAVDEVLENSHTSVFTNYWQEVKQEILNL